MRLWSDFSQGLGLKKILVPVLALIMLLAGGAGAYFYMGQSEAATGDAPAHEAKKAEGEGEGLKIAYVSMDPIMLPIIDREGISQTVSLVVKLEVADETKVPDIEQKLPKLADAFLSDMYGALSQEGAMQGGVIKVSTLKARLASITKRVLGEGAVEGVLLQVLQQHKT